MGDHPGCMEAEDGWQGVVARWLTQVLGETHEKWDVLSLKAGA